MTTPVLEWRCADAAKKLMEATSALGMSMAEGDDLDADQTKIWNIATAAGALVTTDRKPGDTQETIIRMRGLVLGSIAAAQDLSPDDMQKFGVWLSIQAAKILNETSESK